MKVGILTWYFGINYGARAHSLALMNIINGLGYDCEFVNYTSSNNLKLEFRTCCAAANLKCHPLIVLRGIKRLMKYRRQLSEYPSTKKVTNANEISVLGLDALILGSDEILNQQHSLYNDVYYGVGLNTALPTIIFSASSGTVSPETKLSASICNSLRNMVGIYVRDDATAELIENNIGCKPQIVLDPTLMYDFGKDRKPLEKGKYLLIYSFGKLEREKDRIKEFARKNSLKIVCVGRVCKWADKSYAGADLNDWLALYQYAQYIVTDSYHGMIFAIKNHKEFILVSRGDKTNKIDGLRNILNISRNAYEPEKESIDSYLSQALDYNIIDKCIQSEKNRSISCLSVALKEAAENCRKRKSL